MKVKNSEDGGQGRQWLAGGLRKGSSGGNGGKPSVPGFPPSGRVPAVLRHAGRQAPNGSVSGFRGSQKDNGHPPNGVDPGAPHAASARRPAPLGPPVPWPGQRGTVALAARCGAQAADGRLPPLPPAHLCWPGPPHSPRRRRPPEARRREQTLPNATKETQAFPVKETLLGRRAAPRALPGLDPALGRSRRTPAVPSTAAQGAVRPAHRLPRQRLQLQRPRPLASAAQARGDRLCCSGPAEGGSRATHYH